MPDIDLTPRTVTALIMGNYLHEDDIDDQFARAAAITRLLDDMAFGRVEMPANRENRSFPSVEETLVAMLDAYAAQLLRMNS